MVTKVELEKKVEELESKNKQLVKELNQRTVEEITNYKCPECGHRLFTTSTEIYCLHCNYDKIFAEFFFMKVDFEEFKDEEQ